MSIAARVVDGLMVVAGRAMLEVTTEGFGAALSDVRQRAALPRVDPLRRFKFSSMNSNDVRDVKASALRWARHGWLPRLLWEQLERARRLTHELARDTRVARGGPQRRMSE